MGRFIRRIRYLLNQSSHEAQLREEMEFHRAERQDRLERQGLAPDEAAATSRRALGNVTLAREDARAVWIGPWLESVWQDLRVGARMLRKAPGTTAIATMTMALGIGANAAVYSLLDAALFRQMAVRDPERLVFFTDATPAGVPSSRDFTRLAFERLRDGNRTLAGLAAYDSSRVSATIDGEPEMVLGDFVSGHYFDVLGVDAAVGRTLTPADDRPGSPPVAVVSHAYRQRRFGGDRGVTGRTIAFGGTPFTIVGVMPQQFHGRNVTGRTADVWLPLVVHDGLALRDHTTFGLVGRLRPAVTRERAAADLDALYQRALDDEPAALSLDERRTRLTLSPGARGEFGGILGPNDARQVQIVVAIVGATLLIGCVNVANLLLARAASRRREIAVRVSIGAGRSRLVRQLLTESLLLAALGGAAGLLVAKWSGELLQAVLPVGDVTVDPARDAATLAFTAVVTVITGLFFGLAPAAAAARVDVNTMLKAGEVGPGPTLWRRHAGTSLVVAQIAISVTLLVATGLLVHSLQRLYRVDTGLDADRVLFAGVYPALLRYDHARELQLYRALPAALEEAPGIEAVSLVRYDLGRGRLNFIAPHLFATLGVSIVRGRDLTWADVASGARRAVVSETAARQFYPGEDCLGRLVPPRAAQGLDGPLEIVGVVPDIRTTYRAADSRPVVYVPFTIAPPERLGQVDLFVRASGNTAAAAAVVRQVAHGIEPDLALLNLRVLSSEFDRSVGGHRATAALLGACGLLAVILVSVGLYGTMSQAVARRTKELGIRISLGAARSAMLAMMLRESASMVAAGFAIGIPIALLAARGLSGLLFGVGAADPVALAGTVLVMSAVTLVAGYVPARRASRIDPIVALREE